MNGTNMRTLLPLLALVAVMPPAGASARPQRAIVADVVNAADRRQMIAQAATDALMLELTKNGAYEVLSRQEFNRAAKDRHLQAPYSENDLRLLARDLQADVLVTGEIHHVDFRIRDRQKELEVGIVVRVRSFAVGEMVNGAAERGYATDAQDGKKPEGLLAMEAAESAANRAAMKLATYQPVVGTVLNTAGNGFVIINRGADSGIRGKQEFIAVRDGVRVGRMKVMSVRPSHTELAVVENVGGIRPEDQAVAVFPEPRFGPR